jgi:V-type H+-transporting ATPase subunit E
MLNQARLKALKVREDHIGSVLDDARQQLGNVNQDQGKYSQVLYSLILQGLLQVIYKQLNIKNILTKTKNNLSS